MQYSRQILREHGIRGLYRGMFATICRDAPACGIYFMGNRKLSYFSLKFSKSTKMTDRVDKPELNNIQRLHENFSKYHVSCF